MTDDCIEAPSSTRQFDEEASSSAETCGRWCLFCLSLCRLVHLSRVSNRMARVQSEPRAQDSQRYFGLKFCISLLGKEENCARAR